MQTFGILELEYFTRQSSASSLPLRYQVKNILELYFLSCHGKTELCVNHCHLV